MNQAAAIYTRVSSDRQKESDTIASQTAALVEYAKAQGYAVPAEWIFQDEGYSGASLVRPGLEALRDLAAQGQITIEQWPFVNEMIPIILMGAFCLILPEHKSWFNRSPRA